MSESQTKIAKSKGQLRRLLTIGFCSFLIFLSSLLANLCQLINYLTIRFVSIDLYRQINSFFQYIIYAQVVAIAEWWGNSSIRVYLADEETGRLFGREHSLCVSNHRYEVDAVFLWMVCERFGLLGGAKAFGKKDLRFVPIIGWTFFFGEYIFLERNWQKDEKNIGTGLDRIMSHKRPASIMIAAEGTRFTAQKYETSMAFAEQKGLPKYKHHLLPRVKGFAYSVKHLKENHPESALYSIQLAFDESQGSGVSTSNLIKGKPMHGSFYIKRYPICSVPTDSDKSVADFLYDLYKEKDQLMEYHDQHKKFPGVEYPAKRTLLPLIVMWTNFLIVGVPLVSFLVKVLLSGNYLLIALTTLFIIAVYIALYFAIRSSKISKASKYGTDGAANGRPAANERNGVNQKKD